MLGCDLVDDYVTPATCMDGVAQPGEMCFQVGAGSTGFAHGLVSAIAVPLQAPGADLLVTHDDDTLTSMLFAPGPGLGLSTIFWPGTFPEGELHLTAIGDFDEDGILDLGARLDRPDEDWIRILRLDGEGGVNSITTAMTGVDLVGPDLFDADQDGHADLLVTMPQANAIENVVALHGDGNGNFSDKGFFGFALADDPHVTGALDPDGIVNDIVWMTAPQVTIYHASGQGETIMNLPAEPTDEVLAVAVADVDGDGRGDIVVLTANTVDDSSAVIIYTQSGPDDGFLVFSGQRIPVHCGATALAVGDLDGDGKPEIATAGGGVPFAPLTIRLNNGLGAFLAVQTLQVEAHVDQIFIADLNSDGGADLLTVSLQNDNLNMLPSTP